MSRLRVVNLGLPKSGTTTVRHALASAGLNMVDHKIHPELTPTESLQNRFTGEVIYTSYFKTGDPLAELEEFDGFGEISTLQGRRPMFPQMDAAVIEAIALHHPGVRFVASWRDPAAISRSMLNWNNLVTRLERNSIPGLPVGFGAEDSERMRWIEAHYTFLDTIFGGDEIFLQLDVSSPRAPLMLGGHIGRRIKWWGTANLNAQAHGAQTAQGLRTATENGGQGAA